MHSDQRREKGAIAHASPPESSAKYYRYEYALHLTAFMNVIVFIFFRQHQFCFYFNTRSAKYQTFSFGMRRQKKGGEKKENKKKINKNDLIPF